MIAHWFDLLLQANQQAAPQEPPPAWLTLLIMFGPIVILFYFLILRPERKRQRERQRMLESLRKNARVVTVGGIKGVVTKVRDDEVEIRVDEQTGTRLTLTKSSIAWVEAKEEKDEENKKAS